MKIWRFVHDFLKMIFILCLLNNFHGSSSHANSKLSSKGREVSLQVVLLVLAFCSFQSLRIEINSQHHIKVGQILSVTF